MSSFSQCAICPAGYYCTNGTITGRCAAGYLCEYGNTVPDPSSSTDVPNKKKGGLCPLGSYCPLGTSVKVPCTNQTVGYSVGLQSASDCSPCRPGYYCIEQSVLPIDCPAGYYCPGYVGKSLGLIPCPLGTYNPKMFGTDISWCKPCEPGYYCPLEAMSSFRVYPTPPGFYSASGQTEPYPCPGGSYQPKSNGSAVDTAACVSCPIGHYCGPSATSWNQTCPEGTFCPVGSQYPFHCPGGHYCPRNAPDPLNCPAGYYCPPLSTFPRLCWNGTYCPANTEVPLLCPNGYVSRNDTASRTDLEEACQSCPPGTYSTNTLFCELCSAGYVCLGATTTATPTDRNRDKGYICPIGHYCPTGSMAPTACPPGRFNNATGGRTISACFPCPSGFYNPNYGSSTCIKCGKSSTSLPGSPGCDCLGQYRSFQPGDGSCRCIPGYVFYTDGQRLTEEDSALSCQPIVYQRCQPGEYRAQTGNCVSSNNNDTCSSCPGGRGTVDAQIGVCTCDSIQTQQEICDARCLSETPKVFIDSQNNSLIYYDPVSGSTVSIDLDSAGILGTTKCGTGTSTCNVKMVKMDGAGSFGVFNPQLSTLIAATTAPSIQSFDRQLMQSSNVTNDPLTLANPIVCLNNGDAMMWDVSDASRQHFPVYLKDSLLNTNPNFDYTAFRELADNLRSPNLTIKTFMFTFTTEGIYVFADNANANYITVVRVVTINEICPTSAFQPITQTSLVTLGVNRETDLLLAPDWILIGVLMSGLFLLVIGTIGGLYHFRRQTWSVVGTALPKYRNLGMQALARGDFAMMASKGSTTKRLQLMANGEERVTAPAGSSRVITLRLDTLMKDFVPSDFIKIIAEEAGVESVNILILSVTEGTVVRFVVTGLEDTQASANLFVNRIADSTNEIHAKLPILAYEEESAADRLQPEFNMAELEDEFWDYERQIDLEGFNVRTLYDKLEDQTIHIVSQLVNQRDDVLLLSDKILVESEALKDMFLRIKIDLDERNKKDKELQETRDAKLSSGQIDFDLPEDLKATLAKFLEDFFQKNMGSFVQNTTVLPPQYLPSATPMQAVGGTTEVVSTTMVTQEAAKVANENKHSDDDRSPTPVSGAELPNVEGFKDMLHNDSKVVVNRPHKVRNTADMRKELRRRLTDIPPDCVDDSDCEESELWDRAGRREALLKRRLERLRRTMDRIVMPQGLDDREPVPGVLSPDEVAALARQRAEYQMERRKERAALDAVPPELADAPTLPADERLRRQMQRELLLTNRVANMTQVLKSLEPPASLLPEASENAEERRNRQLKRDKFVAQKIEKARRARAEMMVPLELDDDSEQDDETRSKNRNEREEIAAVVLIKNPNVPLLPSSDAPNISESQRQNIIDAADHSNLRRIELAAAAIHQVGVVAGLSDRSDLSDNERQRRAEERGSLSLSTKKEKTILPKNRTPSLNLTKHDFSVTGSDKIPDEYQDDSDLDGEERESRKVLRRAFKTGRTAAVNAPLPEDDKADNLQGAERERRTNVNVAFLRGRESRKAHDVSVKAVEEAQTLLKEAQELGGDADARKFLELGRNKEKEATTLPAEYATGDDRGHRLQQAFVAGRRAQTLTDVPAEMEEDLAVTEQDRRRRHNAAEAFKKGLEAKKVVSMPDELADLPGLAEAEKARRHLLRAVFESGRSAQVAKEVAEEFEMMGFTPKQLADHKAALESGRRAAAAGLHELPTELRDDVPLLTEEEIARRRELQGVFAQGHKAKRGEMLYEELMNDANLSADRKREVKKMYERGAKAQSDQVPFEFQVNPDMTAAERDEMQARRAGFLKGRQAQRLGDMFVHEALENVSDAKERENMIAAIERGREAQRSLSAVPEEIQDEANLTEEERKRRLQLRHALQVGKLVRQAGQMPTELPEEEEEEKVAPRRSSVADIANSAKRGSVTFGGSTTVEIPQAPMSSERERALNRLKKMQMVAFKHLRDKQKAESSVALEELEEESIERAKRTDDLLNEEFVRERKRMAERHAEALARAPQEQKEMLKRSQLDEMQQLQVSQDRERKETQDMLVRITQEKKAKMKTILDGKFNNEVRLARTIQNDQEDEIRRIKDDFLLSLKTEEIAREEDLNKQKNALLERLRLRERRQKGKVNKEKELLEAQLQQTELLERETIASLFRERKNRMIARAKAIMTGASPQELNEEIARIERELQAEQDAETTKLNSRLTAERLEKEKEMTDKHAEEKEKDLKAAQEEVDKLLEAKRRLQPSTKDDAKEDAKIADGVKRSLNLLVQQQKLREELERQRREDAEANATSDVAIKQEAQKEIARREKEAGAKLTDQQKREIIDECKRNFAKMDAALTEDQRRQQEESKKRLEERRRKKESEIHKKQLEEMQAELRRQDEEQQRKTAELAQRIVVKPANQELPPEVLAEEEEMIQRRNRLKADMKRKHDEEQRQLEKQLEEDLKKQQEKELARLKAEAQKKKLELMSRQTARESMQMKEEEKKRLLEEHESESRKLQDQLDAEAAVQRAKFQDALEAKRRRKKAELSEKQRVETIAAEKKQEDESESFVRNAKLNNEKKIIEDTMKNAKGAEAQDVAQVVMSDRHRNEVQSLGQRQQQRRLDEREAREKRLQQEKEDFTARVNTRVQSEIDSLPAGLEDRERRVAELHARAKQVLSEKIPELERKFNDDTQSYMDQLEVTLAEEQLQLKVRQWNEIAAACGMASPDKALQKYQQRMAQRASDEAEDELVKFRKDREAEAQRVREKLEKEKQEYDQKIKAEMEKMNREQEEEFNRREAAMMEELRKEKDRKEQKLREARLAGTKTDVKGPTAQESAEMKRRLLEEYKEGEKRIKEQVERERERQQGKLDDQLKAKREKRKAALEKSKLDGSVSQSTMEETIRGAATVRVEATPVSSTTTINNNYNMVAATPVPQFVVSHAPPSSMAMTNYQAAPAATTDSASYNQWIGTVMQQLNASPIMEKLINIEKMLSTQVKHGLLSYYLDAKDRQIRGNEGRLDVVDPSELPNSQYVVYCFALAVRENVTKAGVPLPPTKIGIAKSLPDSQTNASAFRNSYFYDHARRTLFIRQSRLANIGEFLIIMVHGLAHIKSAIADDRQSFAAWNDADPSFLTEFYGLLEVITEEMFYLRLPPTLAQREVKDHRPYRSDSVMNAESLAALEDQLKSMGKQNRESFLKSYFML